MGGRGAKPRPPLSASRENEYDREQRGDRRQTPNDLHGTRLDQAQKAQQTRQAEEKGDFEPLAYRNSLCHLRG
jgi:hypothetical protein